MSSCRRPDEKKRPGTLLNHSRTALRITAEIVFRETTRSAPVLSRSRVILKRSTARVRTDRHVAVKISKNTPGQKRTREYKLKTNRAAKKIPLKALYDEVVRNYKLKPTLFKSRMDDSLKPTQSGFVLPGGRRFAIATQPASAFAFRHEGHQSARTQNPITFRVRIRVPARVDGLAQGIRCSSSECRRTLADLSIDASAFLTPRQLSHRDCLGNLTSPEDESGTFSSAPR